MRPLRRILPLLIIALLAACKGRPAGTERQPTLRDLHGIAELKAAFNADADKPRVILLLSPT
jgi:hypothetical protein